MRRVFHSPRHGRLVYLDAKATPEYWDARWHAEGSAGRSRQDETFARITARHLPPGSRVLEGGCGRANKVKALADAGFAAVGVDYAAESVERARQVYPGLDIRVGDVRALPFPDGDFDGCWSIGVIEHFWAGYDDILGEARRVLKPGSVLFLTAPWLSPYRRLRVRRGGYPVGDFPIEPADFYQFALSRGEVTAALVRNGFELMSWKGLAPEVCIQEDMQSVRRASRWLYGSRGALPKRLLRGFVAAVSGAYCGHAFLAVARRRPGP